jgi:hypothetical protein
MSRRFARLPRVLAALVASALSAGVMVAAAVPAAATTCSGGATLVWTDASGDHAWGTASNWAVGTAEGAVSETAPGVNDIVKIDPPPAVPPPADPPPPTTIVDVTGSVCDLVLTGGADATATTQLTGALAITGEATVKGFAAAATGLAFTLRIAGTLLMNNADATFDRISLELAAPGGKVDLKAKKLMLGGASTSKMEPGSSLVDTVGGSGAGLYVGNAAQLVVTTGAVVTSPAIVRLQTGSTISTGGAPATLGGSGALNWQAGALAGDLTLALQTVMDGGGTRRVTAGSSLTNTNNETGKGLRIQDGTLELGGPLVNSGLLRAYPGNPGPFVTRTDGAVGILQNEPTGTIAVGASDSVAGSGQVRIDRVPLKNRSGGKITVISGSKLLLTGLADASTASEFQDNTTLSDPFTATTTTPTKGTVQVASGSSLQLKGATTLQRGAILQLDENTNGTKASIVGVEGTGPKLTGAASTDGTFQWRSGTVRGPITIDKVGTDVGAFGTTTRRYLETDNPADAAAITFAGPVAVNATMVTLKPNARVSVTSALVIASVGSGFERSGTTLEGQKLTIQSGASMRRISQAITPGGSSTSSGTTTINVPIVNYGSVTLETSLNPVAGYTQDLQPGAATTAPEPITGLLASAVTLSTGNEGVFGPIELKKGGLGGEGTIAATQLTLGDTWVHPGFGDRAGKLTVQGVLKLSSGSDVQLVMRPAVPAVPASGSTPAVPAKPVTYDVLDVTPLVYTTGTGDTAVTTPVAPGRIDLAGKVTGVSASGFNPAYGTTMANLVKFASRTGSFATASWRGTPAGLGWKPAYDVTSPPADADGLAVDLKLVDVAAPALGLASIPAFTQFTSQRITYAAVDNRTGVSTYDVRWQRGGPNTPYGAWHYWGSWQNTTSTAKTLTGMDAGYTYCFSVRVRDKAGNISAWSQPLCTARMFDDRSFTATPSWSRPGGKAGFYGKTYSRSSSYGAKLTKSGQHTRVAVTALKCPTCGTMQIYSGSTLLKTLSLKSSSTGITTWISKVRPVRNATVMVKVVSKGKPVVVDSFGMVR